MKTYLNLLKPLFLLIIFAKVLHAAPAPAPNHAYAYLKTKSPLQFTQNLLKFAQNALDQDSFQEIQMGLSMMGQTFGFPQFPGTSPDTPVTILGFDPSNASGGWVGYIKTSASSPLGLFLGSQLATKRDGEWLMFAQDSNVFLNKQLPFDEWLKFAKQAPKGDVVVVLRNEKSLLGLINKAITEAASSSSPELNLISGLLIDTLANIDSATLTLEFKPTFLQAWHAFQIKSGSPEHKLFESPPGGIVPLAKFLPTAKSPLVSQTSFNPRGWKAYGKYLQKRIVLHAKKYGISGKKLGDLVASLDTVFSGNGTFVTVVPSSENGKPWDDVVTIYGGKFASKDLIKATNFIKQLYGLEYLDSLKHNITSIEGFQVSEIKHDLDAFNTYITIADGHLIESPNRKLLLSTAKAIKSKAAIGLGLPPLKPKELSNLKIYPHRWINLFEEFFVETGMAPGAAPLKSQTIFKELQKADLPPIESGTYFRNGMMETNLLIPAKLTRRISEDLRKYRAKPLRSP